ncbi:MAG: putative LPS assembly protein LptD, partial [Bacteroidota bacterium]
EAKIFSRKDSTTQKIRLFDNITFSGNYNFAADSFHFSVLSGRATSRLFKGLSTINVAANWDFYGLDEEGQRSSTTLWEESKRPILRLGSQTLHWGKLLRFNSANVRLTTNITVQKLRRLIRGEDTLGNTGRAMSLNVGEPGRKDAVPDPDLLGLEQTSDERTNLVEKPEEAILDLLNNFRISHNFNFDILGRTAQSDTLRVRTHTLSASGSMQLTTNWSVRVGNIGYDFLQKNVTYPDFSFSRNLHCWTLEFSWQPRRGTYGLSLYVTDSPLNFIRIPYGQTVADGNRGVF